MVSLTTAEVLSFLSNFFVIKQLSSDLDSKASSMLKQKIKKRQELSDLGDILESIFMAESRKNETVGLEEEIDFDGLFAFLGSDFLPLVNKYLIGLGANRNNLKSEIMHRAELASKAKNEKARRRADEIAIRTLDAVYDFYKEQCPQADLLLAGDIEDD